MCAASPYEKLLAFVPPELSRDEAFLADLESRVHAVSVRKGDYLIRTGELCQEAYFINRGLFINQYVNENGRECVTGFSADSMYPFVSTIGFFTDTPSDFEVRAAEDGELLRFSRGDIEWFTSHYPAFAASYQQVMLMIISRYYSLFAVRQTSTSEEFMRYLYTHQAWFVKRVPDKYIAQYMGISNAWYCKLKRRLLY